MKTERAQYLLAAHAPFSPEEQRDALDTIVLLEGFLQSLVSYGYEAADQTVQCAECGAYWWDVSEDINQNWHAPGCKHFAARVHLGLCKDERVDPAPEPNPDQRPPAEIFRDQMLAGVYQRMMRIQTEAPPEGIDITVWNAAISEIVRRAIRQGPAGP